MFTGFTDATVDFMWGIRFNNERAWFEAHKEDYLQSFYRPMKELGAEVYDYISWPSGGRTAGVQGDAHLPGRPAGSMAGGRIRTTCGSVWSRRWRTGPRGLRSGLSWGRTTGATALVAGWPGLWTWQSSGRELSGTRSLWKR